jgi:flagellar biosynthesis/type III secretory pathway protein FliH
LLQIIKYSFKHLSEIEESPALLKGTIFDKLSESARTEELNEDDMAQYEKSVLEYEDVKRGLDYQLNEGLKKGREEGMEKGMEKGLQRGLQRGILKGRREGHREGHREGRNEGMKKGISFRTFEIARNGLKEGLSIEILSKLTNLSPEEIRKLN